MSGWSGGGGWQVRWTGRLGLTWALPCVKQIADGNLLSCTGSSAQCCDDLEGMGRGEVQERRDSCIHMADSLCCATDTNSIVKQLYPKYKKNISTPRPEIVRLFHGGICFTMVFPDPKQCLALEKYLLKECISDLYDFLLPHWSTNPSRGNHCSSLVSTSTHSQVVGVRKAIPPTPRGEA